MQHPIGWTDEHDPHGQGYLIMTENGLEVYDMDEHEQFLKEKERLRNYGQVQIPKFDSSSLQ
jgi:hypothetical protein